MKVLIKIFSKIIDDQWLSPGARITGIMYQSSSDYSGAGQWTELINL